MVSFLLESFNYQIFLPALLKCTFSSHILSLVLELHIGNWTSSCPPARPRQPGGLTEIQGDTLCGTWCDGAADPLHHGVWARVGAGSHDAC